MKKNVITSIILSLCLICESGIGTAAAAKPSSQTDNQKQETEFDPFMKGVLQSGATADVPWKKDSKFLAAQRKANCPILMAAYKTVLHDPLPGEEFNVHQAARYINGTVLAPGQILSQNGTAGPYTVDRGYKEGPMYNGTQVSTTIGGGVCKIASTLFNVTVLSNLKVVERHTHTMPVPYVPYGQDATVCYGAKDFKLKNNMETNVLVMAQGVDNILYIGFYGHSTPPKVTWSHEVIKVFKAPVLVVKNPKLPPNTVKITHEGMDGVILTSTITLNYPNGKTEVRHLGKSCYEPLPYIKEISG